MVGVVALVAILAYLGVVALYASSGRFAPLGELGKPPPPGGITVLLTPDSVNAVGGRIHMNMQIVPSAKLIAADGLTFARTIGVVIAPVAGEQSITFEAGSVPSVVPLDIIANGSGENWPFDQYHVPDLVVLGYTGSAAAKVPIRVDVRTLTGYIPGWNLEWKVNAPGTAHSAAGEGTSSEAQSESTIDLRTFRSGSTIAFGIVLLALMTVMACLVLFVSITVFRAKRKVEPSFMSWTAAMLFATVPLRTFLPGSPPIGSWIDYLVVLWVVAGLICGMVIYVSAWWRWGARADPAKV
jgi:hypothetical protein